MKKLISVLALFAFLGLSSTVVAQEEIPFPFPPPCGGEGEPPCGLFI